jgi:hypothetical protein
MRFEDEQVQYSPGQNGEHLKGEGILVLSTLRPLRDVMRMLDIIVVIWILGAFLEMNPRDIWILRANILEPLNQECHYCW